MAGKKGAHHGGAWKVAYADFVTAMMALFMVLWISAQNEEIIHATSRYFQSPFKTLSSQNPGLLNFDSNRPVSSTKGGEEKSDGTATQTNPRSIDLQFLNSVAADFYRMLNVSENLADKPIEIQVTSDGLRVTLFDRARQPLFHEGGTVFTPWGDFVMQSLAWMIDRHKFHVVIEGHTAAGHKALAPDYGAWELSADRSNASRRALVRYAVEDHLIERVSGYGDTRPVPLLDPTSEGNQRVTISLRLGARRSILADS
jgi:chemotaxis protein MotB